MCVYLYICTIYVNLYIYIYIWCVKVSHVQLFATPWTIAQQAPLCMKFSRQQYWRELPLPPPGGPPDLGMGLGLLCCIRIFYFRASTEAHTTYTHNVYYCGNM